MFVSIYGTVWACMCVGLLRIYACHACYVCVYVCMVCNECMCVNGFAYKRVSSLIGLCSPGILLQVQDFAVHGVSRNFFSVLQFWFKFFLWFVPCNLVHPETVSHVYVVNYS